MIRFGTPTCGAAKPTPGALYIVSIMSFTSLTSASVTLLTGSEGLSSTSEPHRTIGRIIRAIVTSGLISLQLAQICLVIAFRFVDRVARKFFKEGIRQNQCDHGLSNYTGRR